MDVIVENAEKRRKLYHAPSSGWDTLQSILENFVVGEKITSTDHALDYLTRWFHIITSDPSKLRTFQQWVMPSPDVKRESYESDCSGSSLSPVSSSASSPENRTGDIDVDAQRSSKKERGDHQTLLRQLLQHQQQQFAIIQQLQHAPSKTSLTTIILDNKSGSPGSILTVVLKGGRWHPHSSTCDCSCGFTSDGSTITSSRVGGGAEGELRFVIPLMNTSNRIVVHLSLCSAPDAPIVCLEPFSIIAGTHSDDDSEGSTEVAVDDDDEDDDADRSPSHPTNSSLSLSPKHLMTIRERMIEIAKRGAQQGTTAVAVIQQPSAKVAWKNRRLDMPYKLRVNLSEEFPAPKLSALAVITDHKGRLQTDAAENIVEDFNTAGVATFNNLRMSKGTWGKEWSINFAVVVKPSLANNPVVLACSAPCPVIVKTRKNPQIRHSGGTIRSESPPSPVFVERKPDQGVKRNRVEDLLDNSSSPSLSPRIRPSTVSNVVAASPSGKHSEDMFSLLCAAEIKQQEQVLPPIQTALQNLSLPDSKSAGFNNNNNNSNIQSILNHVDDIKNKYKPRLSILEQPPLKKDQRVLTVKKGKPFRSPFRVRLENTLASASGQSLSYEQFSCAVVLRNDKGEEVAVKNNEVLFDWNGFASFPGLMVMKGTWGKTVNLTFEARWANRRMDNNNSWPSSKLFIVAETNPIQLMCYTKDKKN